MIYYGDKELYIGYDAQKKGLLNTLLVGLGTTKDTPFGVVNAFSSVKSKGCYLHFKSINAKYNALIWALRFAGQHGLESKQIIG